MRSLDILIIDDERDLALALQEVLAAAGHNASVEFGSDGALKKFRDKAFDIVLTDLSLKGKNGVITIHEISALNPQTRFIIMTGHRMEQILGAAVNDDSQVAVDLSPNSMDAVLEQLANLGPRGIILCSESSPDFCGKLEQAIQQQGKTSLLVSPGRDTAASIVDKNADILILKFCQAPVPEVMIMYLELKQRGYVVPTVMVSDYGVRGQTAYSRLASMPVSGCLFKPFKVSELLQDLQLL